MDKTFGCGPEDIGSIPIQRVVNLKDNNKNELMFCRAFGYNENDRRKARVMPESKYSISG